MPLPPTTTPSGFSTSLLQNNQFYPSYHSYLGFKELNKQVFPLLDFINGQEINTFPYTLTPPDGTDYVIIQSYDIANGSNLILSHSNTSLGGLIIPQNTIFSLMMDGRSLNNWVLNSSGYGAQIAYFKIVR
jgi:hypothetical protein